MLTEQQKEHLGYIITTAMMCLKEQSLSWGDANYLFSLGQKLDASTRPPRVPAFDAELMKAQEVVA